LGPRPGARSAARPGVLLAALSPGARPRHRAHRARTFGWLGPGLARGELHRPAPATWRRRRRRRDPCPAGLPAVPRASRGGVGKALPFGPGKRAPRRSLQKEPLTAAREMGAALSQLRCAGEETEARGKRPRAAAGWTLGSRAWVCALQPSPFCFTKINRPACTTSWEMF
jgi:hypothetical protein